MIRGGSVATTKFRTLKITRRENLKKSMMPSQPNPTNVPYPQKQPGVPYDQCLWKPIGFPLKRPAINPLWIWWGIGFWDLTSHLALQGLTQRPIHLKTPCFLNKHMAILGDNFLYKKTQIFHPNLPNVHTDSCFFFGKNREGFNFSTSPAQQ